MIPIRSCYNKHMNYQHDEVKMQRTMERIRACNYLTVTQIFLKDNFLLERPLAFDDVKPRLLGHWGTCPGINLVSTPPFLATMPVSPKSQNYFLALAAFHPMPAPPLQASSVRGVSWAILSLLLMVTALDTLNALLLS